MRVIHCTPFLRSLRKESLSYFTSHSITPGTLVRVPVRKKEVYALVTDIEDVGASKLSIKDAPFGMKKVTEICGESLITPHFLNAMKRAAEYFVTSQGALLETFLSQNIIELYTTTIKKSSATGKKKGEATNTSRPQGYEKLLFQSDEEDRMASYRSLIREHFAKNRSVFILVPTQEDASRITPLLTKGISEYAVMLHGSLSKKERALGWEKVVESIHPLLIVATGSFLSIPREDLGAIVVERENSSGFKTLKRPYLDMRTCAQFLAQELGIKFIVGDVLLRTETLYEREGEDVADFTPLKFRSISSAQNILIDMKANHEKEKENAFVLLGKRLRGALEKAQESNERFFLLTARRGLYPITLCNDCGDTIRCRNCDAPLVLHGKTGATTKKRNVFLCHICSEKIESKDMCMKCGSWRFATLGIGSERVEREVLTLFPQAKVFRLDKDSATTKTQVKKIIESFEKSQKGILVGTEMAVSHLEEETPHSAVVSVDSLFTIPDFRIHERVFALLLRLRSKTQKQFLIQTRLGNGEIFTNIIEGNLTNFYRHELALRKKFSYPPFSLFIKLTRSGKKDLVEYDMAKLRTFLKKYDPVIFNALTQRGKTSYTQHALLRLQRKEWPDDALRRLLGQLPPSFSIRVDPENIL
ncbi:MAG: hypothetical protein WD003_00970 [Candidatus Paceibacterota bacterium]